jgi:Tol biopolymer transport system component
VIYPIGAGDPKFLPTPGLTVQAATWLPDGNRLLLAANESGRGVRIYMYEISSEKSRALTPEGYRFFQRGVSPDGKVVVVSGPDRRRYLYPLEGGEPAALPFDPALIPIGWSADGQSLCLRKRGEVPSHVLRADVRTGKTERWRDLIPGDSAGVTGIGGTFVAPDGNAYAYSYLRSLADLYVVEGLE